LGKTCPSRLGLASAVIPNTVSLVPRLMARSPGVFRVKPTIDARVP